MRKCSVNGEVAVVEVVEVGLRMTRDRTDAAMESKERKRKVGEGESEVSRSSKIQLKSRRLTTVPENSSSPATSENISCESITSNQALASCCSSNGLTEVYKESFKFVDLQDENEFSKEEIATSTGDLVNFNESKVKIPSCEIQYESGEMESTARPHQVSSRRRHSEQQPVKPSEAELEEFFAAAEKDLQQKFAAKYNYDIVKDEPLEGRYEWVQLQVKP